MSSHNEITTKTDRLNFQKGQFFQTHLSLTPAEADALHQRYYIDYGLAIEGLVRHHRVDPLSFNAQVDDAIPLEDIFPKPDAHLRRFLRDRLDRRAVKPWLLTNAYVRHARRVLRLLGVEDMFEGLTYCDYAAERIICKPFPAMYEKAMREAGVEDVRDCYFVGMFVRARVIVDTHVFILALETNSFFSFFLLVKRRLIHKRSRRPKLWLDNCPSHRT